jgi:small-conductance mechanosensitive channel
VRELYANPLSAWVTALIAFAATFAGLFVLRSLAGRHFERRALVPTHVQALLADLVRRTRAYFILFVALWAGSLALALAPRDEAHLRLIVLVVTLFQGGVWGSGLVGFWVLRIVERREADAETRMTISVVGYAARIFLWVVVLLLVLDNLGVNITALVTGLGIGGVAVALALQNILGDIFAALSIVLDKPFVVGDPIAVDDVSGSVEHIGLKSTRLRSITGELVIISNGDLLKSRIRNFRGQEKRLVTLKLRIAYGTPADKLARVPEIVRDAVHTEAQVRLDRTHFSAFGTYALVVDTVYAMDQSSYAVYMDTQQRINLEIYRRLSAESIELAHPTAPCTPDVK